MPEPLSPEHFAFLDAEADAAQRVNLAVSLDDVLEFDGGHDYFASAMSASTGMPCLSTPSLLSTLMRTR